MGFLLHTLCYYTAISHSSSSFCESDMGTLSQDLMTLQIDLSTLIINNSFISFEWINSFNCNESDISLQTYKNITTSIQQFSSKCCDNFFASSEDQNDETSFFKLSVVSGDVNCNYHPYQHFFEGLYKEMDHHLLSQGNFRLGNLEF